MNRIINHTISTGNVWEEVNIAQITQIFGYKAQARTAASFDLAYVPNPQTFWTVKSGVVREHSFSTPKMPGFYVRCATGGTVIEIELQTGM